MIFSGLKLEPVLRKQIRPNPDIRVIFSGPKLEHVLPKQNRPNLDIRDLFSGPDNSLISGLHCTNNLNGGISFQVFLPDINNYLISRSHSCFIAFICLHIGISIKYQ